MFYKQNKSPEATGSTYTQCQGTEGKNIKENIKEIVRKGPGVVPLPPPETMPFKACNAAAVPIVLELTPPAPP